MVRYVRGRIVEREDPTRAGIGAPQSYFVYRAEVERCRGREGMHMQIGVGRAGRGQRIVRRGVEEGAEQDAWRGKVCCEGLEDKGYETFKNTCHASAAGPAGMTQCAYRVRCAAHQHGVQRFGVGVTACHRRVLLSFGHL